MRPNHLATRRLINWIFALQWLLWCLGPVPKSWKLEKRFWKVFGHFGPRRFYPEFRRKNPEVRRKKAELGGIFLTIFFLWKPWQNNISAKISALMALNSQLSKSLSSSTLLRGAELLRSATMSIESDPQLAEMQEELSRLKVASLYVNDWPLVVEIFACQKTSMLSA